MRAHDPIGPIPTKPCHGWTVASTAQYMAWLHDTVHRQAHTCSMEEEETEERMPSYGLLQSTPRNPVHSHNLLSHVTIQILVFETRNILYHQNCNMDAMPKQKEMMNACMYYYCHIAMVFFPAAWFELSLHVGRSLFPNPKNYTTPCCVLCIVTSSSFDRARVYPNLHKVWSLALLG